LREPEILAYFPFIIENFDIDGVQWKLCIIPHARLRSVQRGISIQIITSVFRRFVNSSNQQAVAITVGNYSVTTRPAPRNRTITIRFDIDEVSDTEGAAHVVTVVCGMTTVDWDEDTVVL